MSLYVPNTSNHAGQLYYTGDCASWWAMTPSGPLAIPCDLAARWADEGRAVCLATTINEAHAAWEPREQQLELFTEAA